MRLAIDNACQSVSQGDSLYIPFGTSFMQSVKRQALSLFLSLPLPLSASCSVNHCIWLGYWHPFLMLLTDNKEPNTKLSFLSLLLLGSLLCPDNNNNLSTITTTTTTTVAIIADNQSLHVFHFVFLHSFFWLFF